MESLPHDLFALSLLVFVLGMKHGFDTDHLATIDGLTRFNTRTNPRLARFCGALFSLGHGIVVIAIALFVSTLAHSWQVPTWLTDVGAWISIFFLAGLGFINLRAVLNSNPSQIVRPTGFKAQIFGVLFSRITETAHPVLITLVGALFAISFDTISQAALFALTATQFGDWHDALLLGLFFMLGMLVTDGINGLWISHLIRRADQIALVVSRIMGLTVAGISLLVAAFGVMKIMLPPVDTWSEGREIFLSATLIGVIAGSFLLATRMARMTRAMRHSL
jgi:high-affinity nickel-transport protein